MTTPNVQLGDKAKDTITGFEGICVARTEWLNGCWRITLQNSKLDKDGKPQEGHTFDEPQLIVTKPKTVPVGSKLTGGPKLTPTQHRGAQR